MVRPSLAIAFPSSLSDAILSIANQAIEALRPFSGKRMI